MLEEELLRLTLKQPNLGKHLIPLLRKASSDKWKEFLDEKYEGGKKKVPNPNQKTRDKYPHVTLFTAIKTPSETARVRHEYELWLNAKYPETKHKPTLAVGTKFTTNQDLKVGFLEFLDYDEPWEQVLPKGTKLNILQIKPNGTVIAEEFFDGGIGFPRTYNLSQSEAAKVLKKPGGKKIPKFLEGDENIKDFGAEFDYSDLKDSHRKALEFWSGANSHYFSHHLRYGEKPLPWVKKAIRQIDAAFKTKAAIVPEAVKAVRLVGTGSPIVQMKLKGELKPGYVFKDKSYVATSLDSGFEWEGIRFEISLPKGSKGIYLGYLPKGKGTPISGMPWEYELLLNRGSKFRVKSVSDEKVELELLR